MPIGFYAVVVSLGNQVSSDAILFEVKQPPPPTAFDSQAIGEQAAVQNSILISLNFTSSSEIVATSIETTPMNGDLFQFSQGSPGSMILDKKTPLVSPTNVYYKPKPYFSGNDNFTYN